MKNNLESPCMPNTVNKAQSTECINTPRQASNRHTNFTNATKQRIRDRLRCKAYDRCRGVIETLLFDTDNGNKARSCQFRYIELLGESFIQNCSVSLLDYEGPIYHMTIVSDEHNHGENCPDFNMKKLKNQIRSFVARNLSEFSAIGFIEFQYVETRKDEITDKLIGMHCHMILYGSELTKNRLRRLKAKNRRFYSSLTKRPIVIQNVENTNDSKHRIFSYLIKLPTKKLKLVYNKEKTKSAKRPVSFKQQMRILEILSYIPISSRVFAIGQGREIKKQVLSEITYRKNRSADPVLIFDNDDIHEAWVAFWKAAREEKYKSPIIHI